MANKTNLPALGKAPNFTGITAWFNTPGNQALSLSQLAGQGGPGRLLDVLLHQLPARSLPHVEGWYNDYKNDGFVVVGVSAPSSPSNTSCPT